MKQILFATGNKAKGNRFSRGLLKNGIEVITLTDINVDIDVDENGNNAIENALIKARAYNKENGKNGNGIDYLKVCIRNFDHILRTGSLHDQHAVFIIFF